MVGHGGISAGSYLADPTSPIPSHCASIVATSTAALQELRSYYSPFYMTQFLTVRAHFPERLDTRNKLCQQLTLTVLVTTIDAQWEGIGGCRVGEVQAGATSPMPDHKGFKLQ